ncbi:MAG: hypothetical protein U9R58_10200 [Chloroflexota bacterium]|nr:hypothetical protein [Chloroflexota bacterium]
MENKDQGFVDDTVPEKQTSIPPLIMVIRWMFCIQALVWIIFGAFNLVKGVDSTSEMANMSWIMSVIMFGFACLLIWVGWSIGRMDQRFFFIGLIVLGLTIILTVTDEFGVFDLIILVLNVVTFALLIMARSKSLSAG